MLLNPNCMRDILLTIRNNTGIDNNGEQITLNFDELCLILDNYSKADITFAFLRVNDESLVKALIHKGDDLAIYSAVIFELTDKGDKLLNSILDDKKWKTVLKKLTKYGSISIPIIKEIIKSSLS